MEKHSGWSVQTKEERIKGKQWMVYYGFALLGAGVVLGIIREKEFTCVWVILGFVFVALAAVFLACFIRYQIDVRSPNGGRFLLKKLKETKQPQEYIEAMQTQVNKAQEKGKDYSVYAMNLAYGLICNAEFERAEALLDSLNMPAMSDNLRFVCQQHKVSIGIYEEDYEKAGDALPALRSYLGKLKVKQDVKDDLSRLAALWEYLCTGRHDEALIILEEIERTNAGMDISYIWMYRMQLAFSVGDMEKGRTLLRQIQERKNYPVIDKILERYQERS